ncbi:MAG: asparaginase [Desulfovibrio sp.]|uniref:asparaginase n=1 Tax=Desulfovibrio sp. 7SRBS1 TaxID=3378064 RepID=UPI003B40DD76
MKPLHLSVFKVLAFSLVLLAGCFFTDCAQAGGKDDPLISAAPLPKVVIVATGGTIAEKVDPKTGGAVPALTGQSLVEAVPQLAKIASIEVVEFSNIDSSHMTPEIWARLSSTVAKQLARPEVKGVVVTHGTDTMAEGAYFLDLTIASDKPVVFTGAMNDASSPFPDGPGNLLNAVTQASSPKAEGWGVTVTLNNYINSARATRKTQTTNVQTFKSGERGFLGYIFNGQIQRFNKRPPQITLPVPKTLPKVVYLATYAGADGSLVRHAVDNGARGLVIDGLGSGNVNEPTYEAIRYALSKHIPVVISTVVNHGSVEPVYGGKGGGKTLEKDGCILAGDLGGNKARLLLILGIAHYGADNAALKKLFAQ